MDSCGAIPRDRRKFVTAVGVTFGALAVTAFGLRILSKWLVAGGSFGLDDYTMGIAVVGSPLPSAVTMWLRTPVPSDSHDRAVSRP
jgi:hypothetical protein